jgi:hypothetical protein
VVCVKSARVRVTTSSCEDEIRGQVGDGPCISTVLPSNVRISAGLLTPDVPPRGVLCYMSDGLFCDDGATCAPLKPVREACSGVSCVAGAYCRALICTELTPAEGACAATTPINASPAAARARRATPRPMRSVCFAAI